MTCFFTKNKGRDSNYKVSTDQLLRHEEQRFVIINPRGYGNYGIICTHFVYMYFMHVIHALLSLKTSGGYLWILPSVSYQFISFGEYRKLYVLNRKKIFSIKWGNMHHQYQISA